MPDKRQLSPLDHLLSQVNRALNTLDAGDRSCARDNPAGGRPELAPTLTNDERRHVAGLMRINHAGEVCAQALYEGQALAARSSQVREAMQHAADEETDHLAWCEDRLRELGARPTVLNPLWYSLSFGLGVAAGRAGDQWSLGFVAETERQVCEHLQGHLEQLPRSDQRSRKILSQMQEDEAKHATMAVREGAAELPPPVKRAMRLVAGLMTKSAYRV